MNIGLMAAALLGLCVSATCNCTEVEVHDLSTTPATNAQRSIVVQNFYYALPGKAEEVYRWRLHASAIRGRLGLAVGRVLRRKQESRVNNNDVPDVIWECEYPDTTAREADVAQLGASKEFADVEAHMQKLIRKFRRVTFSP